MPVLRSRPLTSPDVLVLRPAQTLCSAIFSPPRFQFLSSFDNCFFFFFSPARSSSPNYCRAGFNFSLFFFFCVCVCVRARCHGGFTNAHLRFGDESGGEIIQIPALPLSRSDSLTKLSDPILAPAVRVNLLCHLQSTRGGAASPPPLPVSELCSRSAEVCSLSLPGALLYARISDFSLCSFGLNRINLEKSSQIY